MASAPLMIVGLATGLFVTFYGYLVHRALVVVRSTVGGALLAVVITLLIIDMPVLLSLLARHLPFEDLVHLVTGNEGELRLLLVATSAASGSLLLFFLARSKSRVAQAVIALSTSLSTAIVIAILASTFLNLQPSLTIAAIVLLLTIPVNLLFSEVYYAGESALVASLIVALLITRFWYLDTWIFYSLWAILSLVGMLNQQKMIRDRRRRSNG
jgi:hypothetical protein